MWNELDRMSVLEIIKKSDVSVDLGNQNNHLGVRKIGNEY